MLISKDAARIAKASQYWRAIIDPTTARYVDPEALQEVDLKLAVIWFALLQRSNAEALRRSTSCPKAMERIEKSRQEAKRLKEVAASALPKLMHIDFQYVAETTAAEGRAPSFAQAVLFGLD